MIKNKIRMTKFFSYFILLGLTTLFFENSLNAQTISIASDKNNVCIGTSVTITATITGADTCPHAFKWYNNGSIITGQTQSTYTTTSLSNGDKIKAELTITSGGCTNVISSEITMNIIANATIALTSRNNNQSVCVNSSITNIVYNIGGGATSASVSGLPAGLSGSYNGGVFTISGTPTQAGSFAYTVNTSGNCTQASAGGTITVNSLPVPILTSGKNAPFDGKTYFVSCSGSTTGDITIFDNTSITNGKLFDLSWGDGSTNYSSSSNGELNGGYLHTFPTGIKTITYQITDNNGCIGSANYFSYVGSNPALTVSTPGNTSICKGNEFPFPITAVISPNTSYLATFNDGTPSINFDPTKQSILTHLFDSISCYTTSISGPNKFPNSFSFNIVATNPCGSSAGGTVPIYVSDKPNADFSMMPTTGPICINSSINLSVNPHSNSYSDNNGCSQGAHIWSISPGIRDLDWTVSGTLGTRRGSYQNMSVWQTGSNNLTVTFLKPNTYTIKEVTGNPNCNLDSLEKIICVNSPNSSFSVSGNNGCTPLTPIFSNTTLTPFCGANTYLWNINYTLSGSCLPNTSKFSYQGSTSNTSATPQIQFTNPGTYAVTLTTTTPGCAATTSTSSNIIVKGVPTLGSISLNPGTICQNSSTTPSISLDNCLSTTAASYSWSFQDGTPATANISNPGAIVFNSAGTKSISVNATNECGTSANTNTTLTVNPTPDVNKPTDVSFCNGAIVPSTTFTSTTSISGTIYTWSINQSIGLTPVSTSTSGNLPSFTATNNGTSDIIATVTVTPSANNCTGTSKTFTITVHPTPATPTIVTPLSYCKGATANALSATSLGSNTLNWYTVAAGGLPSSNTPTLSTATAGTQDFYVSQTDATTHCESNRADIHVTINPIPSIAASGNNPQRCSSATGSITITGLPPNTTYILSYNNNTISPNPTSNSSGQIIISNLTSGSYNNITVADASTQCPSNKVSVSLSDPSAPSQPNINQVSPQTLCSGLDLNLSASGSGGTLIWSGPGISGTTSGASVKITGITTAQAGQYSVYENKVNCISPSASVNVIVNQTPTQPTASSNSPVCSGNNNTINLTSSTTTNGATYSWNGPNSFISNLQNPLVANPTTNESGNYTVTATSAVGGCTSANTTNVTINPTPSITTDTTNPSNCTNPNGSITINGLVSGSKYDVYWNGAKNLNNTTADGNGKIIISGLSAATYTDIHVFSNPAGCKSNTITSITLTPPNSPAPPVITQTSPVTLCSGATLTLTAPGSNVLWSVPGGGTVTGTTLTISNLTTAQGGTYNVTQTINNCNSSQASIAVVVNQTPITPTVNSKITVCSGNSINLTANTSTPSATYSWSGPNSFTSNLQNPSIPNSTTNTAGTYTVTATSAVGGCTSSSTTSVTVNITPTITANPTLTSQCQKTDGTIVISSNTSVPLINSISYTINYIDRDGTTLRSSTQTPSNGKLIITGLGAGDYNNISITANNCPSNTISTITVSDPSHPGVPVISTAKPISICSGQDLTLSISNPPKTDTTYTWSGPGISSATTGTTITIKGIANNYGGKYTVSASSNGCISPSDSITVTVNPTPAVPTVTQSSPICSGSSFTITASNTPQTGITYNWTKPNNSTAILNDATATVNNAANNDAGQYTVTATLGTCTSNAANSTITVNSTPQITVTGNNPTACATATGSIMISGVINGLNYTISYSDKNGVATPLTNQVPTNGTLSIPNLYAGTYTSINVTQNSCISSSLGPISLSDPNPPSTPTIATINPICSQQPLPLAISSLDTAFTYIWTLKGGITQSTTLTSINIPSINLANAGVVSVTATKNSCISAAGNATIVVDSTPVAPSVTSPLILCSGLPLSLTASSVSTGAGTISYAWHCASPSYTSNQQNPIVNSVSTTSESGSYLVTATSTVNGLSCTSAPSTLVVVVDSTPLISVTGNNPTACATATGSIKINGVINGLSYTINYSDKNGNAQPLTNQVAIGASLSIPSLIAGTYSGITVTQNGCTSASIGPISLSDPNPPSTPTIAAISPVCSQQPLTLSISSLDTAFTYNWTLQGGITQSTTQTSVSIPSISLANAGVVSVTATKNSCISVAGKSNIIVDSTPVAPSVTSPIEICSGNELKLNLTPVSTGSGTITYAWTSNTNPVFTSSDPNPVVSTSAWKNQSGNYSVIAISTVGALSCSSASSVPIVVTVDSTPVISDTSHINPTACNTATGSIKFKVSYPNVAYQVSYNGLASMPLTSDGSGYITIPNLKSGNYTNISVVSPQNCPSSNKVGPFKLIDPTPPIMPIITGDSVICSQTTLNLLDTNAPNNATYSWQDPAGHAVGISSPNLSLSNLSITQAGTYSLIVTVNSCASPAGTKLVTIDSTPLAPSVNSPIEICSGNTLLLVAKSVSTNGGNISYAWTCNKSSYKSALLSPTVSGAAITSDSGVYTIKDTSTINGLACISAPSTIVVIIDSTPVLSDTSHTNPTACNTATGTITFKVSHPETSNYKIGVNGNSNDTLITPSNSGMITITGLKAGIYSNLSVTSPEGCQSNIVGPFTLIDPTPPIMPIITGDSVICSQTTLNLFDANAPNNATYSWQNPAGHAVGVSSSNLLLNNLSITQSGTYSLTVTVNNCVSPAGTKLITIDSTPLAPSVNSPIEICSGNTLLLVAKSVSTNGGNISYAWTCNKSSYKSALLSPTVSGAAITSDSGVYTIKDTSTINGLACISAPSTIVVIIDSTPVLSDTSHTNPTNCASYTGTINFKITNRESKAYAISFNDGTQRDTTITPDGNGFMSIIKLKAGNYSNLSVTTPEGCKSNVIIDPITLVDPTPPPMPIIVGDSAICSQQSTLNLRDSIPPASTPTPSYLWQDPHGTTIATTQNLTLSNLDSNQSGLYRLTVTVSDCISPSGTKLVSVDSTPSLPSITATTNPICTNKDLILHANTISPGNMSYNWTGPNSFIGSTQDTVIKNIFFSERGNYTSQATSLSNGCKSMIQTLFIEIDSTPKITRYDSINPTNCATNTGKIILHGLTKDSLYSVHYFYNSKDTFFTQIANGDSILISQLFAGTYSSITVTKTGCPSNIIDSVKLKDPNPPSVPNVTVDSNHVCSGTNLHFSVSDTTSTSKGAITYQWSGPNGFDSTSINPLINNIYVIDSGKYSVIAIQNSCKSNPYTLNIAVDTTPTRPVIASIPLLCSGSSLNLNASDTTSGSFNYHWSGPDTTISTIGATSNISFVVNQTDSGVYKVYVTSLVGLKCKSSTASDTVVVYPALTQANIGNKKYTICNFVPKTSTDILTLSGNLDNTRSFEFGRWKVIDSVIGSHPIISDTTIPNATITFDLSGNYSLVWAIGNNAHCEPTTDTMRIKVVDQPAISHGSLIASKTIICQGNPVLFTVDSASTKGIINKWQYMMPYKSGVWKDTLVKHYNLTINLPDTFAVRVVLTAKDSLKCASDTAFSDSIQVMVAPPSKAGNAYPFTPDTVCIAGNTGTIKDSGNIGTIVAWQQSTDSLNFTNITGSGGNSYSYSSIPQTTWYRAAIKSGVCDSVFSNSVRIIVLPLVTPSVAGNSVTLCDDSTYQLAGNAHSKIEMGKWTFESGSSIANFVDLYSPTTTVTKMLPNSIYKLDWTISNGFCPSTTSSITITNDGPLVNTIDTALVTICYGVTENVSGGSPTGGSGAYTYQWQIMNKKDSTWSNLSGDTLQNYNFVGDTTVILRRQVTSFPCSNTSLIKIVTVEPPIGNNFISGSSQACINTSPGILTGSKPTGADENYLYQWQTTTDTVNIQWNTLSGADTINYMTPVLNVLDTNYYRRIVTSNLCSGSQANISGTYTVYVRPNAIAQWKVGIDSACAPFDVDDSIISPIIDTVTNSNYQWFVSDSLYGNSTTINPGYIIQHPGDSVIIKMVSVSRYGCRNDSLSTLFFTPPAPKTKFLVSDSSDCGPLVDTLTNITPLLNHFHYIWNFGFDSTAISTLAQPGIVIFPPNGFNKDTVYIINLVAFNECDTMSYSRNIKVRSRAKSIFTPAKTFGCSPLTDTFVNTSRGDSTTYVWQFGDGYSLSSKDTLPVTHTYHTGAQDTFRVKLLAENYCGNDTSYRDIVVAAGTIKLRITVNGDELTLCNHSSVHFINTTTGASSFIWDFGDGNQAVTRQSPYRLDTIIHQYDSVGVYNVSINASNNCTDTIGAVTIKVLSTPVASFVLSPDTVCIGHPINMTNTSDATTGLVWNFGDGNTSLRTNPTHAYKMSGNFDVQLIAERQHPSANVCRDTAIRQVTIIPSLPGFIKATDSVSTCVPFTVTFSNTFAASTKLCTWNFGDGSDSTNLVTGNTVTHTFTKVGVYNVSMSAADTGGCNYVATKQITVNGPAGTFVYDHGIICGKKVADLFEATVTGTDSLKWNFGDGEFITSHPNVPVYYQYPQSGKFLPQVTLMSGIGGSCKVILNGIDTVINDYVNAAFSLMELKVCDSTTVSFVDNSQSYLGLKTWLWNFGDSKGSPIETPPPHLYLKTNTWDLQLIVQSNSGCSDTANIPTLVKVNNTPKVDILADTTGCQNQGVVNNAAVTSDDPPSFFDWEFSNGTSSNTATTNAFFSLPGNYKTTLIVGTAYGCYDTSFATIKINPTPQVLTNSDFQLCLGQSNFINTTGAPIYEWTPSAGLSCNTCPNPIANPTVTTRYVVAGYNNFGCAGRDTLLVTVIQPFVMTTIGNDTMCLGDKPKQLAAFGATNYNWSPPIGLNATNIATPLANPELTTHYRVIGTDDYHCFADTSYLVVAVGTYPQVSLGQNQVLSTGTVFPINPVFTFSTETAGPISKYTWSPSIDLSCDDCPNPLATVENDVCYTLIATNIYGCSANVDTLCIKAFCKNTQVFIANAFTPDGDGKNDKLMVQGKGIKTINSFRIFNRWGQVVFERTNFQPNDQSFGWDGKIKGVPASPDVYVYTCEVVCENEVPYTFKGNVSIIK